MHFTVNLSAEDNQEMDFSYGLVFIPCPVWVKGTRKVLNLNPERPDYQMGSVRKLLQQENLEKSLAGARVAHIIIHSLGHGSGADLSTLKRDLSEDGFSVHMAAMHHGPGTSLPQGV